MLRSGSIMAKGNTKGHSEITEESEIRKIKDEEFGSQRVYKKTSPNSVLTLYLGTRDVICRHGVVEPLRGVLYIDPKFVPSHKIYGQLTLTFRYGREDEEVMGLKFCNEAIIALKQIWPSSDNADISPLQQALVDRLGKNAFPFSLEVGVLAPPSVQLIPAKRYNGAPIGTSYDVRIHMAGETEEERPNRRCMVKLGVRVIHKVMPEARCCELPSDVNNSSAMMPKTLRLRLSPKTLKIANKFTSTALGSSSSSSSPAPTNAEVDVGCDGDSVLAARNQGSMSRIDVEKGGTMRSSEGKGPEGSIDKPFLWTEGRVSLRAALNKSAYGHGEHISVTIDVRNNSRKIIRKIRIFAVQHVDVCMFSNGKFKNVVAEINEYQVIKPNENQRKIYSLLPIKGPTKNWIAVEGTPSHTGNDLNMPLYSYKIASSAPRGPTTIEERNVFAIYVSYYIKIKLTLSAMGGEVVLKLPFILGHVDCQLPDISPAAVPLYDCVPARASADEPAPYQRDRWATANHESEDTPSTTAIDERNQHHDTDDCQHAISGGLIEPESSDATAARRSSKTEPPMVDSIIDANTFGSSVRKNTHQDTITKTLNEIADDVILDEEEHLRLVANRNAEIVTTETSNRRGFGNMQMNAADRNVSDNLVDATLDMNCGSSVVNVVTAQIHI